MHSPLRHPCRRPSSGLAQGCPGTSPRCCRPRCGRAASRRRAPGRGCSWRRSSRRRRACSSPSGRAGRWRCRRMCGTARTPAQGGTQGHGADGERWAWGGRREVGWGVRSQGHGAGPVSRCSRAGQGLAVSFGAYSSTERVNTSERERGCRDRTCAPSAASATVDAPAAVKVARRTARLSGMSSTCPGEGQERCFTADSVLRRRRLAAATGRRLGRPPP